MAEKLSARTADKVFNKLPAGLVDLCIRHYELLFSFENIRQNTLNTELINRLDVMADKLKDNVDILISLIGNLTSRDIRLHTTAEGDTLWKLSRRYKSDIREICEINTIQNVLKPYEKKYLLIPTRP
jgi:LysM domain.